ncbi:mechanosensitive ion channel family protein [Xanthomarina sp. F1114]|uniref:mechanosensitive ion channel family protein n=1 Tax=Xanthomarina sp. F1114 TaxID=2996019 RepID=UPI00225E1DE3|nr:mechanosensitive ion channel family protein [Xanthomarina sp. F1114]MCX7547222.1 mechanosensitive ion channel family protein [Xanthomarina sp. F1114]
MKDKFSVEEAIVKLWDKIDGWLEAIILKLPNLVMAIGIMILFYFLARIIRNVFRKYVLKNISQKSIQEIISRIIFLTVVLIGFFIALSVLNLNKVLTSVLAGAGVLGLVVGLALQGILTNTFGGLILSFMPNIRINDYIETNSIEGFVSEISLRNIVIRRSDNNYVIVPNSKFIDNAFTNYSLSKRSRIDVSCRVGYESDIKEVEDLVTRIITENFKQIGDEYVEFYFTEFDDSSIKFMTRFWINMVKSKDRYQGKHKAITLIKNHFDENNIRIPYPIHRLNFDNDPFNNNERTNNNN